MKPIKTKNVSTYVAQWLTSWVGFLSLGLLGVVAATLLLGNVYIRGIRETEVQIARTTEVLTMRTESLQIQLQQIHREMQKLSDLGTLNMDALEEILRESRNSSGISSKLSLVWQSEADNFLELSVPDATGDGRIDLHAAVVRASNKKALWATDGKWDFVKPTHDYEQHWFVFSKPIKSAEGYVGMATLYADFNDMRNLYTEPVLGKPFGWVMISERDGSVLGDVKAISGKSLDEVAYYLNHNMSTLAAQKGYARLRSQFFGPPVYVFPSDPMPGWLFYELIPPNVLFEEQITILFFTFAFLLLLLLVSLVTGVRFTKRITKGLVRLTSSITDSQTNELLQLSEKEESYEIITLTQAFNQTLTSLEVQNQKLIEESERNRHLTADVSRFYTQMRLLNENNLHIDLFDYLVESKMFHFSTGLVTLYGSGSQIHREIGQARFFADYEIEPGIPQFDLIVGKVLTGEDAAEIELRAVGKDGEGVWLKCWLKKGLEIGTLSGALMDVSEEVRRRLLEKELMIHDSITGLYNRNALEEIGVKALSQKQKGTLVIFAYITLAGYNAFEVKHGMVAGNHYIQTFSELFKAYLPPTDFGFRWLGSHFLVILNGMSSIAQFRVLCARLNQIATTQVVEVDGIRTAFPLHIGFSVAGEHGETAAELLEHAAFAEHEVTLKKMSNPNLFDPTRFADIRRETLRKGQIPDIIAENKLFSVFQPIISLKDGELYGFEALTRTTCEEYPAIIDLIEDAEEAGYSIQLEKRMVENALKAFELRGDSFQEVYLFINTAPYATLALPDYENIRDRYFENMNVIFEVVETRQMDPGEMALRKEMVRATGAKFALDDFGAGYSNHIALLALEPDIIKIDRELIRDIDTSQRKQQLLEDLIGYARMGGTKVLAEGVETQAELRILCHLGVDFVQGFLVARPSRTFVGASQEVLETISQASRPRPLSAEHIAGILVHLQEGAGGQNEAVCFSGFVVMRMAERKGMYAQEVVQLGLATMARDLDLLLGLSDTFPAYNGFGEMHAVLLGAEMNNLLGESIVCDAVSFHHADTPQKTDNLSSLLTFADRLSAYNAEKLTYEMCQKEMSLLGRENRDVFALLLEEGFLDAAQSGSWRLWMRSCLNTSTLTKPTVDSWLHFIANCIDIRTPYGIGHTAAAEVVANMIAHMMKINWQQSERIRIATLMRGIGKISIPTALLGKIDTITREERQVLVGSAEYIGRLLVTLGLTDLAAMVYPEGQKNSTRMAVPEKDLILAAGIVKAADVLTALDETRSYRQAMSETEIRAVLADMMMANVLHTAVVDMILENLDEILLSSRKARQVAQDGHQRAMRQVQHLIDRSLGGIVN